MATNQASSVFSRCRITEDALAFGKAALKPLTVRGGHRGRLAAHDRHRTVADCFAALPLIGLPAFLAKPDEIPAIAGILNAVGRQYL